MSDLLRLQLGARPWLPADDVTPLEVLNEYDIPLSGLIEQEGMTFLYACLLGELEELNIWAYSHLSEAEAGRLRSLLEDDLAAAIDEALANRMLVVALAHDAKLADWGPLDAGMEGPLGLAARFTNQLRRHLSLTPQDVDALERLRAPASR
jgi:hypothetical protein